LLLTSAIFAVVTLASAIFAVVTLASAILTVVTASVAYQRLESYRLNLLSLRHQLRYQRRIVPSKIFAVVTASAAISAARIKNRQSWLSLQHHLQLNPVLSIVTAPDNGTASALPLVLPTNTFAIARSLLEFNACIHSF
jgi:Mn2+/Fe2+ NRAMP family transporter